MRRQLSDSAVISTGRPGRVYCQVMSWLRVGPPRTLTLSGLRLTKRGTGRPLDEPAPSAACATVAVAMIAARAARVIWNQNQMDICKRCIAIMTQRGAQRVARVVVLATASVRRAGAAAV